MTESLNRKFDVLLKSGMCPPYLLDVITLLVAHANETELFKKELRSAPFESAVLPKTHQALPTRADEVAVAAGPPRNESELRPEADQAAFCAEERLVDAAEKSLRLYAADLKNMSDIAMATSSKKLREMKTHTFAEMTSFQDRVIKDALRECQAELDSLQAGWLGSMNGEVARLEAEVHQVGLASQKELYRMLEGCSDYMSKGFQLLNTEPLENTHRIMADCMFFVERLKLAERQMVPRVEMDAVCERLKNVERIIARTVNDAPTCPAAATDTSRLFSASRPGE